MAECYKFTARIGNYSFALAESSLPARVARNTKHNVAAPASKPDANPPTLRDLCRYALRQHLGTDNLTLTGTLPLPKPIIDYLLFRSPANSASMAHTAAYKQ